MKTIFNDKELWINIADNFQCADYESSCVTYLISQGVEKKRAVKLVKNLVLN